MSGFRFDFRVTVYYSLDFYRSPVIVELEAMLIDSGQAWLKAEGAAEEGNET